MALDILWDDELKSDLILTLKEIIASDEVMTRRTEERPRLRAVMVEQGVIPSS